MKVCVCMHVTKLRGVNESVYACNKVTPLSLKSLREMSPVKQKETYWMIKLKLLLINQKTKPLQKIKIKGKKSISVNSQAEIFKKKRNWM